MKKRTFLFTFALVFSFCARPSAPQSRERLALGRQLFFDTQLSMDGTVSCASCHIPDRAFADNRPKARGIQDREGERNTPALINVGAIAAFSWDGREPTLERQMITPILNPKELGLTAELLESRTGKTSAEVAAALAEYVRSIRSAGSRFDQFLAGDNSALTDVERVGFLLFRGRGQCVECHSGPDLTDDRFHNTGVAFRDNRIIDEGRLAVSEKQEDRGAFKTPTLREIERTAPYMHDGSIATLEAVVEFYSLGGRRNAALDSRMRVLDLTKEEKRALVAFLRALSGTVTEGM